MHSCTENRFLRDIAKHEMIIISDDGVARHLKFRTPGSSSYWFDLITWTGHLCITGDCGTFVFRRIEDMFEFFRMSEERSARSNEKLYINAGYWHEKVQAEERPGGCDKFSEDRFKAAVKEYFNDYFEGCEDQKNKAECWSEVQSQILNLVDNEYEACRAVYEFEYNGFTFQDFFEISVKEYTFYYIWCLYAIVWGIIQYDKEERPK